MPSAALSPSALASRMASGTAAIAQQIVGDDGLGLVVHVLSPVKLTRPGPMRNCSCHDQPSALSAGSMSSVQV